MAYLTPCITVTEHGGVRRIRQEGRRASEEIHELEQVIGDEYGSVLLALENLRCGRLAGADRAAPAPGRRGRAARRASAPRVADRRGEP